MQGNVKHLGKATVRTRHSCAFTLLEVITAAALLAMLLIASVQMLRALSASQRASERRTVALEAVQAVSDQIANIPWNELSTKTAEKVSIPEPLNDFLRGAMLSVFVDEIAKPNSKRIRVEVTWNGPDGAAAPVEMTTWVFPERSRSE
jgi:hypothetical protein